MYIFTKLRLANIRGSQMKIYLAMFLIFMVGCADVPTKPIEVAPFNCTGTWSNISVNMIQFSLFILQKGGQEFTGDVFSNKGFIGTIDNGKIIGEGKYVSFTFKQQSPWGESSMGFNGRFYLVDDRWELRGILGGRVHMAPGVLGQYSNENYKFAREEFNYLFKK